MSATEQSRHEWQDMFHMFYAINYHKSQIFPFSPLAPWDEHMQSVLLMMTLIVFITHFEDENWVGRWQTLKIVAFI